MMYRTKRFQGMILCVGLLVFSTAHAQVIHTLKSIFGSKYEESSGQLYVLASILGTHGTAPNQLDHPDAIAVGPHNLYIVDTYNNRIVVWSKTGKVINTYGSWGTSAIYDEAPNFFHPAGIMLSAHHQIYVADTGNDRIVLLNKQGLVITSWGTPGQGSGNFNSPRSIDHDYYGNIWVLDSGNSRIEIFTPFGQFISAWGQFGTQPGELQRPMGMALNFIDQAIIADTGNDRVEVFNSPSAQSTAVTIQGWLGSGPDEFRSPAGVVVTPNGITAVIDGSTARVEFYNNRFYYIGQWQAPANLPLKHPPHFMGIASAQNGDLYITDIANSVIFKLKLLHPLPVVPIPPTPTPSNVSPYSGSDYPLR